MGKAKYGTSEPSSTEFNQLVSIFNSGKYIELENRTRALLERHPASGFAWKLLGAALQIQGKDALPVLRKATEFLPNDADAFSNLGVALKDLGQFEASLASFRRALQIKPDFAEAHSNMGATLAELGQLDEAVKSCRRSLELKPDYARAHNNLGNALKFLGKLNEAVASYRSALKINPGFFEAHNNLGNALHDLGHLDEAVASYRRALELNPDYEVAQANLLSTLNYTDYSPEYYLEEARKFGRTVAKKVTSKFSAWLCDDQPRRLKVGMVSGSLYSSPAGFFLESLLAKLDPDRIDLIAYPTNLREDDLSARIKPRFSAWKPLIGKNDESAAQLIHADGVHILMDLAGHSAHNRLPMFAWKPAPVQVSWLDYFASTGLDAIDYLLADNVGVPEAHRGHFSETVWYLPDTRLCFSPPAIDQPVSPLPALQNGYITFGCFQSLTKIGDSVLAAWGKIFAALPNARLRMQCKQLGDKNQAEQMIERLQRFGIASARIQTFGSMPREAYQAAHAEVDLILDTFPFPGGTTTCEGLWMGVPTLTLAGDRMVSRQGASMLMAAGLGEWVASNKDEYISKAVTLASDISGLADLRTRLRSSVLASPLFDATRFARNFEAALWGMWKARKGSGRIP